MIREGWWFLGVPIAPEYLECDNCHTLVLSHAKQVGTWQVAKHSAVDVYGDWKNVVRHLCPDCQGNKNPWPQQQWSHITTW